MIALFFSFRPYLPLMTEIYFLKYIGYNLFYINKLIVIYNFLQNTRFIIEEININERIQK